MSYVVSSYVRSTKTLRYMRARTERSFAVSNSKILVVAIPPTPGKDNLKVSDEIAAVKLLYFRLDVSVDFLEHRLADELVRCMIESSVVHSASHPFSDNERPSLSALYLEHGDDIDKLSVGVLQTLNHQLAQVAYLSACSTARIGARNLSRDFKGGPSHSFAIGDR